LRKYLIVAIAAFAAIAFATVAVAQSSEATSTFSVSPKKAGTKRKPKGVGVKLGVANNNPKRTLAKIAITFPKTMKLSGKGFKTCSQTTLDNDGKASCPKGSKVGSGVAHALNGVNTTNPTPLTFDVTAFVGGKNAINFYLESRELSALKITSPGKIKGQKLTITVPQVAQSPAPGTFAGLVSLDTSLKGKAGKHKLISTVGCKAKKQKLHTVLTFIDNGVSPAGTVTTDASAPCKK
jgi:hypothetical protein